MTLSITREISVSKAALIFQLAFCFAAAASCADGRNAEDETEYVSEHKLTGGYSISVSNGLMPLGGLLADRFCQFYGNKIKVQCRPEDNAPWTQEGGASGMHLALHHSLKRDDRGALVTLDGMSVIFSAQIAIIANRDNPVRTLSLQNLTALFCEPPADGQSSLSWSTLGVPDPLGSNAITVYGRLLSDSVTYQLSNKLTGSINNLSRGIRRAKDREIVADVARDKAGVAYVVADLALLDPTNDKGVKIVSIQTSPEGVARVPSATEPEAYPLASFGVLVSGGEQSDFNAEWTKFSLSKEGRELIRAYGFFPYPTKR